MLYDIVVGPIENIVNWVFLFITRYFSFLGIFGAILGVSIVINFLTLPIYNIADKIQMEERKISKKLESRVKKIKKAFKGDEQFMMLQTYYRENNYHPLYVLRSALPVLIQIPFFMAAYNYLSNCDALLNVSFWIFDDLGSPDNFFTLNLFNHNFAVNILPILMTVINLISGYIYTKDAPMKEKVQLYIMASVFLVLLYNSPSGLVIYWILNNIFSLIKNIVMKMKKPWLVPFIIILSGLILLSGGIWILKPETKLWKKVFCTLIPVCFGLLPLIIYLLKKIDFSKLTKKIDFSDKKDFYIFLFSAIGISFLCGFVLPSSVIATSPEEFSFLGNTPSPTNYVFSSLYSSIGLFLFWPTLLYFMFGSKSKKSFPIIFLVLFICALSNVYLFSPNYGNLSVAFRLDNKSCLNMGNKIILLSTFVIFIVISIFIVIKYFKLQTILSVLLLSVCIAELCFGIYKTNFIRKSYNDYAAKIKNEKQIDLDNESEIVYNFSKNKQNVIVFFLDRAIGSFVPNIFEDIPELTKQFQGFTYYPNCLSFGQQTVYGYPPIVGGYEYTQEKMNERADELLVDKHNEALLVMPKLFLDKGYDVTVTDPSYVNYTYGDLTPYEKYPEMNVSIQLGKKTNKYLVEKSSSGKNGGSDELCKKQIVNFSILEVLNPMLRSVFYTSIFEKFYNADGFFDNFSSLFYLCESTSFDNDKPTYTFLANDTDHEPMFLIAPEFEMPGTLSQTDLGSYNATNEYDAQDYSTNKGVLIQVGKWLNYLKENDVYDNSRIIIVSDHGHHHKYEKFNNFSDPTVPSSYNPLLLFKDFNSKGELKTDMKFMTNADTLFLAKKDLDISSFNPFTGKEFVQNKDFVHVYPRGYGNEWNAPKIRDKKQFVLNKESAWEVRENIFDPHNWKPLEGDKTLVKEEKND